MTAGSPTGFLAAIVRDSRGPIGGAPLAASLPEVVDGGWAEVEGMEAGTRTLSMGFTDTQMTLMSTIDRLTPSVGTIRRPSLRLF